MIQPLVQGKLGAICMIPERYDTDKFGTFSGEVERERDAITTLRKKILSALDEFGVDMGIGSEGSFGEHPFIPFSAADEELVMLIDRRNNFEIGASYLTEETNYRQRCVNTIDELKQFAKEVHFPSHALIVKTVDGKILKKGIDTWEELLYVANQNNLGEDKLQIETDMRAMHNPMRMEAIKKATELLIEKILVECPNCHAPGFDVKEKISGLPCEWCGTPSVYTKTLVRKCWKCSHTELADVEKKLAARFCEVCNP
ncbi:MAG: hypothetical protein MUF68_01430 [Cyclobacteriaceae bacterium]|nr:hypothetical protein [Cyclobacteriaceae bacterium]